MVQNETEKSARSLVETFTTLSIDSQKLLISMVYAGEHVMKKDAMSYVSDVGETNLDKAISELIGQKLLEQGKTNKNVFVIGDGDRYRLTGGIAEKIKNEILKQ